MNGVFVVSEGGHLLFRKAYGPDLGLGACDGEAQNVGAVLAALHQLAQGVVNDSVENPGAGEGTTACDQLQRNDGLTQYETRGACVIFRRSEPFCLGSSPRPRVLEAPVHPRHACEPQEVERRPQSRSPATPHVPCGTFPACTAEGKTRILIVVIVDAVVSRCGLGEWISQALVKAFVARLSTSAEVPQICEHDLGADRPKREQAEAVSGPELNEADAKQAKASAAARAHWRQLHSYVGDGRKILRHQVRDALEWLAASLVPLACTLVSSVADNTLIAKVTEAAGTNSAASTSEVFTGARNWLAAIPTSALSGKATTTPVIQAKAQPKLDATRPSAPRHTAQLLPKRPGHLKCRSKARVHRPWRYFHLPQGATGDCCDAAQPGPSTLDAMLDAQLNSCTIFPSELWQTVAIGGLFRKILPPMSSARGGETTRDEMLLVLADASLTVFLPCSALRSSQGASQLSPHIAQTDMLVKLDALGRLFEQFPSLFRPALVN